MVAVRGTHFERLAVVLFAPLVLGSWGCSSGSSDGDAHGPAVGPEDGGRDALLASDATNGSPDAASSAPDSGADTCTGSVAVFGGAVSGATTVAFGATLAQGESWVVSSLPTNVGSPPAIVAYGSGFAAAFLDATGDLEFATSTWVWSSPARVVGLAAKGSPSLAVVGTSLHIVYQGDASKYFHGIYTDGSGWGVADDAVGGAKQGFGPSPPVAANVTGALLIAYEGQDGSLYDEAWSAGAWAPDNQHTTTQVGQVSPAILALNGGPSDTLVVYADPRGTLYGTSRSGGRWSVPTIVNANAFTNASPSLAPLAAGRAVMTYLGTDELAYFSVYDPSTSPPWTTPAAIGTDSPVLASPPSVAPGVCGDDAVAVLVEPAGAAVVRYAGGAWTAPTVLAGTAGMKFASVATHP